MSDATIKNLRQRPPLSRANLLKAGAIEMDLDWHRVWVGGKRVALAWQDFEMLRALLEAKGDVVRRDFLLEKIWGYENPSDGTHRIVDVHILRLRNKLGPEGRRILTVRNVGYRFDVCLEWIKFGA